MPDGSCTHVDTKILANRITAILNGVIVIMTAELSLRSTSLKGAELVAGALLVGAIMTVTKLFIDSVHLEIESQSKITTKKFIGVFLNSIFVMVFPLIASVIIVISDLLPLPIDFTLDEIMYAGAVSVIFIAFISGYLFDRDVLKALRRSFMWTVVCVLIVLVRKAI